MRFPLEALDRKSASGAISRRGWQADDCVNELAYFKYVEFPLQHRSVWIALTTAKFVDSPLKRAELGKSQEISRVRGDHRDP